MTRYSEHLEQLIAQSNTPLQIAAGIQSYVRHALTWTFEERLESTGFFQHSVVPDFSLFIGEKQVDFYLRFDPISCLSLLEPDEGRRQNRKKVVLLLVPDTALNDQRHHLSQFKDRKTVLITSVECVDYLAGLAARFEAQHSSAVGRLAERIEQWFDEASGVVSGAELERYCRASLMEATLAKSGEVIFAGSLTIGINRDRGGQLAEALTRHPVFREAKVRALQEDSWNHPYRREAGWPDVLITYQAFDSERPLFAVFLDRHLPLGLNSFQEYDRPATSARLGIPFVVIAPHRGLVFRENDLPSVETASPLIYHAFLRLWDIYAVPALFLAWPVDHDSRLMYDQQFSSLPPTDDPVFKQLTRLLESAIRTVGPRFPQTLLRDPVVQRARLNMEGRRLARGVDYVSRPHLKSLEYHRTEDLLKTWSAVFPGLESDPTLRMLNSRDKTVLLSSQSKVLRTDPYLGTLELFDFAFCRFGPQPEDRLRNLGIRFPMVELGQVNELLMRRSVRPEFRTPRLFFQHCDLVILGDGVLVRQSSESFTAYLIDGNIVQVPVW